MRKLIVETLRGRPQILCRGDARSVVELHRSFRYLVAYRLLLAAMGEPQDPSCDADATIHARSSTAGDGAYFPSSDSGPCLTASRALSVAGAHRRLSQSGCCLRREDTGLQTERAPPTTLGILSLGFVHGSWPSVWIAGPGQVCHPRRTHVDVDDR